MGEQVLTLGLATEEEFLPLDSNIFISQSKAQGLNQPFSDQRSVVAKRYQDAVANDKPSMAEGMIQRAQNQGIQADYLVADAWFGTKRMVDVAISQGLTGIFRMKKGQQKFTAQLIHDSYQQQDLNLKERYHKIVKSQWRKVAGLPWKACSIKAEMDLNTDQGQPARKVGVKLLFVRGLKTKEGQTPGRKDWAVFLTTDATMSMSKMLEVYALRWSIEVYFKEAKQHLGFLKEQTVSFASHIASIHLTAIRYLVLVHAKNKSKSANPASVRRQINDQMNLLSMAGRLWQMFRTVIQGALNELSAEFDVMGVLKKNR
ncbi:transposase [Reinekea marinisedimentorum]|uniref:DDE superfamily endonuclease n=1 Tax=Reinekea marinisedimentorum TaxID=230495 RepID=A0A4R3HVW9_9GAMM|nr:transposase [Reinekea marinisedimentorum]TCS36713.1 DDE superfamily endonuclease [Reinekea marinisedimentorum]